MPLPPYITETLKDKDKYQTVYAKYEGSAAAPTAGLHFTNELLDEIRNMGVIVTFVTLHVSHFLVLAISLSPFFSHIYDILCYTSAI